jgi:hypothetical protein
MSRIAVATLIFCCCAANSAGAQVTGNDWKDLANSKLRLMRRLVAPDSAGQKLAYVLLRGRAGAAISGQIADAR